MKRLNLHIYRTSDKQENSDHVGAFMALGFDFSAFQGHLSNEGINDSSPNILFCNLQATE